MTRLSNLAAQTLQRQIHDGQLKPGQMLPGQRELAIQLGISRTVLREAISTLEALGLVQARPGKGVQVTAGGTRSAREIPAGPLTLPPATVYEFRAVLEPAAAALAAQRATPAAIQMLQATQARLEEALNGLDLVGAGEADLDFHMTLAEASGNALLASTLASLTEPIGYSLRLPFADTAQVWAPADEHREVIAAIVARDATTAKHKMLQHIVQAAARTETVFETP